MTALVGARPLPTSSLPPLHLAAARAATGEAEGTQRWWWLGSLPPLVAAAAWGAAMTGGRTCGCGGHRRPDPVSVRSDPIPAQPDLAPQLVVPGGGDRKETRRPARSAEAAADVAKCEEDGGDVCGRPT